MKRNLNGLLAGVAGMLAVQVAHAAPSNGSAGFSSNCAACHQADGKGVPGAFPALANNKFLTGPDKPVIDLLLAGRGAMPNFRDSLSDDQIASILSYARSAWGNSAPAISRDAVARQRAAKH